MSEANITTNKPSLNITINAESTNKEIQTAVGGDYYYAQLAKEWATKTNGKVLSEDYSAKYYAQEAKKSVGENLNIIENAQNQAINNIQEKEFESIENIENQTKDIVEVSISSATTALENSNLAKQWAISEIIVDDTDYSAKYYAEKAKDNSGIFYDELTEEDIDVNIVKPEYITQETDPVYSADKPYLALKSEIPTNTSSLVNDSDFATKTDVMSAIASISQFKVSIVTQLPTTGEKMTLYLVAKTGTGNDVYNEYLWIEETSTYEFLGTTAVDLTDYVKNTDYATVNTAGVIKYSNYYGSKLFGDGKIATTTVNLANYSAFPPDGFIGKGTLENVKNDIVKRAITANDITLTDAEKASAQDWLGVTDLIGDIETLLAGV